MSKFFARLRKDEKGATAIEYGLIAALISVGIIAAAGTIGTEVSAAFKTVATTLSAAPTDRGDISQ